MSQDLDKPKLIKYSDLITVNGQIIDCSPNPELEYIDARLEYLQRDEEKRKQEEKEERTSFLPKRVCYKPCCNYSTGETDFYNIDLNFSNYFEENSPYLKKYVYEMGFTKYQIETLFEFSRHFNMCDAINYTAFCHCCGEKLVYNEEVQEIFSWWNYGDLICSKACEKKMNNNNICAFGKDCNFCQTSDKYRYRYYKKTYCCCYVCNIDGDEEVNHFNRLNNVCFEAKELETIKMYSQLKNISLRDSIFYKEVFTRYPLCRVDDDDDNNENLLTTEDAAESYDEDLPPLCRATFEEILCVPMI